MGMEDIDAASFQFADDRFALVMFVNLMGIEALTSTPHYKNIWLMRSACVYDAVLSPCSLRSAFPMR